MTSLAFSNSFLIPTYGSGVLTVSESISSKDFSITGNCNLSCEIDSKVFQCLNVLNSSKVYIDKFSRHITCWSEGIESVKKFRMFIFCPENIFFVFGGEPDTSSLIQEEDFVRISLVWIGKKKVVRVQIDFVKTKTCPLVLDPISQESE